MRHRGAPRATGPGHWQLWSHGERTPGVPERRGIEATVPPQGGTLFVASLKDVGLDFINENWGRDPEDLIVGMELEFPCSLQVLPCHVAFPGRVSAVPALSTPEATFLRDAPRARGLWGCESVGTLSVPGTHLPPQPPAPISPFFLVPLIQGKRRCHMQVSPEDGDTKRVMAGALLRRCSLPGGLRALASEGERRVPGRGTVGVGKVGRDWSCQ